MGQPQASLAQQLSRFLSVAAWCLGDQDSDWGKAHRAITEAARKIARDNSVLAPLREGQTDAAATGQDQPSNPGPPPAAARVRLRRALGYTREAGPEDIDSWLTGLHQLRPPEKPNLPEADVVDAYQAFKARLRARAIHVTKAMVLARYRSADCDHLRGTPGKRNRP